MSNTFLRSNRRTLLSSLGLTGGSLFLPSLLGRNRAHAAAPKRLVLLMTMQGTTPRHYNIRKGAPDESKPWTLDLAGLARDDFSRILRPFYDYRHKDDGHRGPRKRLTSVSWPKPSCRPRTRPSSRIIGI